MDEQCNYETVTVEDLERDSIRLWEKRMKKRANKSRSNGIISMSVEKIKELGLNWDFPHGQNLTPSGANSPGIDRFSSNIGDSLTREVIQNSLDASNDENNSPVIVKFHFFEIKKEDIPDIRQIEEKALKKALKYWNEKYNHQDTIDHIKKFSRILKRKKIPVLKISDYNTTGLNEKNYESLIIGNSFSVKQDSTSAGSKGIGKAAPFAATDLRMVFYNSVSTDDGEKSAGVLNFVSFPIDSDKNIITQERAVFSDSNQKPVSHQLCFDNNERSPDDYGTDLYIIGLKHFDQWADKIRASAISNFLFSIFKESLVVYVEDEKIDKDNLYEWIEKLEEKFESSESKRALQKSKKFYQVLKDPEKKKFYLDDEMVKDFDFIESAEDAVLYLLESETPTRTILQTRKTGMKINERNRISKTIKFTGIFHAEGRSLNEFLRKMESANHDKWSTDRLDAKEGKIAKKFLSRMLKWYKEKVNASYGVETKNEIDAFGVKDLLPLGNQENSDQPKKKDSGINNKFEDLKIKRKTDGYQVRDGDREEKDINKVLTTAGVGEGDTSGLGSRRKGESGGSSPSNRFGFGKEKGSFAEDNTKEKNLVEKELKIGSSGDVSFKIIEEDATQGKYRLLGKTHRKLNHSRITLKCVGADGNAYKLDDLAITSDFPSQAEIKKGDLWLKEIDVNTPIDIGIKISSKIRMKMEGTIYEVES